MPCTYEESPQEIHDRKEREFEARVAPLRAELNLSTRLLCELTKGLTPTQVKAAAKTIPGLREWMAQHAEKDRKAGR